MMVSQESSIKDVSGVALYLLLSLHFTLLQIDLHHTFSYSPGLHPNLFISNYITNCRTTANKLLKIKSSQHKVHHRTYTLSRRHLLGLPPALLTKQNLATEYLARVGILVSLYTTSRPPTLCRTPNLFLSRLRNETFIMSAGQSTHPALTEDGKLKEALYLAWWKGVLGGVHNQTANLTAVATLRIYRDGEFGKTVDDLEGVIKDLYKNITDSQRQELLKKFCRLAYQIALEEFDAVANTILRDVFDFDAKKWDTFLEDFVEDTYVYRYG